MKVERLKGKVSKIMEKAQHLEYIIDPEYVGSIFNKLQYAIMIIEDTTSENNLVQLDKPINGMKFANRIDDRGNFERVPVATAREALEICVEQMMKYLSKLPKEEDRKKAEELLLKAKLYLAGA